MTAVATTVATRDPFFSSSLATYTLFHCPVSWVKYLWYASDLMPYLFSSQIHPSSRVPCMHAWRTCHNHIDSLICNKERQLLCLGKEEPRACFRAANKACACDVHAKGKGKAYEMVWVFR